ncbi:MAG: hypothetical protein ACR2NR_09835, partial [Solirubrobacteraceae bacterium]
HQSRPADDSPRSVARAHARAVLAPTLARLADSAIELLGRMLPTEPVPVPVPAPPAEVVFTTSV